MNLTVILEILFFLVILVYFSKKLAKEFEDDTKVEQAKGNSKNVIDIKLVSKDTGVLSEIKEIDGNFTVDSFLGGAKEAFKMIVTAFNKGDMESIKTYISKEVYDSFDKVITKRNIDGLVSEFELVGFAKVNLKSMKLTGNIASMTVEYITNQSNYLKDNNENIIKGVANYVNKVTDIWTFMKDLKSKDPNWTLIATQSV